MVGGDADAAEGGDGDRGDQQNDPDPRFREAGEASRIRAGTAGRCPVMADGGGRACNAFLVLAEVAAGSNWLFGEAGQGPGR